MKALSENSIRTLFVPGSFVSEGSCQTEDHSQRGVGTPEEGKDSEESKAGESKAGEGGDIEQVMSMLRRVTPDMVQMLTANTESTALDNYPPPPPQQGGFGSGLGAGRDLHECNIFLVYLGKEASWWVVWPS